MGLKIDALSGKVYFLFPSSEGTGSSLWTDEGDLLKPKDGENIGVEAGKRIYFDL